jgi:hypothetical protein
VPADLRGEFGVARLGFGKNHWRKLNDGPRVTNENSGGDFSSGVFRQQLR